MSEAKKGFLTLICFIIIVVCTIIVVQSLDDDDTPAPAPVVTVQVDGSDPDAKQDEKIVVPEQVVKQAQPNLEDQLRDETPPEATAQEIDKAKDLQVEVKGRLPALPVAGASAGFAGCRTTFVNNQSSRRGVRPIFQVLHYTVSPNRPGWSDVDAIIALFDRPSSQASSHFIIDREGHCAYIVPIEAKSWTQAAGNPLAVSYEIINSGRESGFLDSAGYAKLKSVMREVSRRTGIPMRAGDVSSGKSGIVQHKDGGNAWGGHVDITPFLKSEVIKKVVAGSGVTSVDRTTCRKLNWWRRAGRPHGLAERRAIRRRDALGRRGVTCTTKGPVKR